MVQCASPLFVDGRVIHCFECRFLWWRISTQI